MSIQKLTRNKLIKLGYSESAIKEYNEYWVKRTKKIQKPKSVKIKPKKSGQINFPKNMVYHPLLGWIKK